jgi:hypothetical protein
LAWTLKVCAPTILDNVAFALVDTQSISVGLIAPIVRVPLPAS